MAIYLLAGLGVLLVFSAFFSSTETAFTSLSAVQVRKIEESRGRRGKRVAKLSRRPDILLTTLLIGNNLVNIAASAIATALTIELFGSRFISVTAGILTLLILIFCEVTPKQIALVNNEQITLFSSGFIHILTYLFRPLIWGISVISNFFTRIFTPEKREYFSLENLLHMVHIAEDMGIVESHEKEIVKKVFRINEIMAQSIMTHRKDVFFLDREMPLNEAYPLILESGYSRIPVYQDNPENIVGIVLLKDLIKNIAVHGNDFKLKEIMVQPLYVPETKRADDLFFLFKKEKLNMAIVLDEYGGLAGVVSREDVVEELLGELYDENEQREGARIKRRNDNSWIIKGDADFFEIQDIIGINLQHDKQILTISGYLMDKFQEIPEQDSSIELDEGTYEILKMDKNRIDEIIFTPAEKPEEE